MNLDCLEIKKLKRFQTRDGYAFDCDVFADGVKIAHVQDDGRGGDPQIYWESVQFAIAVQKLIDALPPVVGESGELRKDFGWIVEDAINKMLLERDFKRDCKKGLCWRTPDQTEQQYWRSNEQDSPESRAAILKEHPGSVFLNDKYGPKKEK